MFHNLSLQSFASIARDKLHTAASQGVRDNARLHKWVLLKNSLTTALSRSTETPSSTPMSAVPVASTSASSPNLTRPKHEDDDDEYDAFLFPDGDVFSESFIETDGAHKTEAVDDGRSSEAQWLNSLLASLEDSSEHDALVTVVPVDPDEEEDEESELMSLLDLPDLSTASMASSSPESILLPPSPPLNPFDSPRALHNLFNARLPITYSIPADLADDIDALTLPDVIEDSSSDTDSESLNTPYTRSTSSLNSDAAHGPQSPGMAHGPFIRIVDRDGPETAIADPTYPYQFEAGIDATHQPEDFQQEC